LGYGPSASDPRTGEILNATVNIADSEAKALAYQIDFYLQSIGTSAGLGYANAAGVPQEWPAAPPGMKAQCTAGQVVAINPAVVQSNHNANSTLFTKIQQYLGKPSGTYGNLGPQDFIPAQDQDFFNAYYTLIPYAIFADPDMNPFVIREGGQGIYGPANFWKMMEQEAQFHQIAATIDRGLDPYVGVTGPQGIQNATAFINNWRQLTQNHADLEYAKHFIYRQQVYDPVDAFSIAQIADHAARHCIADPGGGAHWETKAEWTNDLISSFYEEIAIHEFGHTLGLQHNFLASVDKPNFPVMKDAKGNVLMDPNGNPRYALYSNSVMEYNARMGDVFDVLQWGPYDQGALGWAYSNDAPKPVDPSAPGAKSISGQIDAKTPWNDPIGFQADGKTEIAYLSCHDGQIKYTPLCRQFDIGTTPSEIIANEVDQYDWQWAFNNFRVYRKFWDNERYADRPANLMMDMRRFLMLWVYDWNSGELTDTLRRIGFHPPAGVPSQQYYSQLENKFNKELSSANQIMAAFHKAVIQQSTGERPVATIYDQFYGDVTQQGIILDKLFAMEFFVGLWPGTNYDPNQAGAYFSSYANALDASYQTVAEDAVDSMIGGQYDAFPYFAPLAVSLFAQDTHSPSFSGRIEVRNWIGGRVFARIEDFLAYFRDVATQNNYVSPDGSVDCTKGFDACSYDPRPL
ncbi:MAG TPA: zinc-dependent metalloprotease, partial [Chloroflexota bacterium]|nr:zinc-dependent metalloprotease [Chloroflexota bacterium]